MAGFRFEHIEYLYLLLIIPLLALLYIYSMRNKKKAIKEFGNMRIVRQLMPDVSLKRQYLKYWLVSICVVLFIFLIARPQFGSKLETVKRQGVEVMVCLDVSKSMLSTDISPSRLEKSKQILSKLVDNLRNDKIGLIVFAGDAYVQLPITSDYVSAKMFLTSIDPSMVPVQGTSIGAAIKLATRSFTPNSTNEKAIVLITDGENHDDDAIGAVKAAAEKGIITHVLGVGLPAGAPIPIGGNNNFLKDKDGNVVITKLNEEMGKQIAAAGGGIYARTDNTNASLRALQQEIEKMNKADIESKVYTNYNEKYQIFAWIILFILVFEFFILDRKNRVFKKITLFK
ncbi:MAG: VWA domain-containing protein [Dysgonamonadaceae bacterium]|jgi:Ca-activated chloride channel family protein|nr:VWA domain-containing protein [Dysgonamonadaceae bacterium]